MINIIDKFVEIVMLFVEIPILKKNKYLYNLAKNKFKSKITSKILIGNFLKKLINYFCERANFNPSPTRITPLVLFI